MAFLLTFVSLPCGSQYSVIGERRDPVTIRLLELGKIAVPCGLKGDQNRAKAMVGDFPSAIDLSPADKWFPRVNDWPEGTVEVPLAIAWFPGETFGDFDAVSQKLASEKFGEPRLTVLPHLAAAVIPRCDELWQKCQAGECPRWIHTSSPASFWQYAHGNLFVPYVYLDPDYRQLRGYWIGYGFGDLGGFLVVCES